MNKTISKERVLTMAILLVILLVVYFVFLYNVSIIKGEEYYAASSELQQKEETVTAARGDILDRLLELIDMVEEFGDTYIDDLPVSMEPPFEYDPNMTEIQRTMLEAYFKDKAKSLPENPTAVELLSYMRTRYDIDSNYSAEDMRKIAGLRYSINVRYAINTADYVFVQDASMKLITSIMETKLAGIQVKRRTASSTPSRPICTATTARCS